DKEKEKHRRSAAGQARLDLEKGDSVEEMIGLPSRLLVLSQRRTYSVRTPDMVDPDLAHANVPWERCFLLPYGIRDSIVARTLVHIGDTAGKVGIEEEKLLRINDVAFEVLMSVASMTAIKERFDKQQAEIIEFLDPDIDDIVRGASSKTIHTIPLLALDFRTFIFEAKRAASLNTRLFDILLGMKVKDGHFHKLLHLSLKRFGEEHQVTQLLKNSERWIEQLIDMRNAIEHPKNDDYVEVSNFSLAPEGGIYAPHATFENPKYDTLKFNVEEMLSSFIESVLNLFEQFSSCLLVHSGVSNFVQGVMCIPDEELDERRPVRYKLLWNLPFERSEQR
ncbi:MAG: hypothetical protein AB3N09_01225, partial [Tateyamaria sp.]